MAFITNDKIEFSFFLLNFTLFDFVGMGVVVARAEGRYKGIGNEWG